MKARNKKKSQYLRWDWDETVSTVYDQFWVKCKNNNDDDENCLNKKKQIYWRSSCDVQILVVIQMQ